MNNPCSQDTLDVILNLFQDLIGNQNLDAETSSA